MAAGARGVTNLTRLQIREGYKSRNEKSSPRKIIIWARKKGLSGYWRGYKLEGVDGPSSCVDRAQGRPPNPPQKKEGYKLGKKRIGMGIRNETWGGGISAL